MSKHTRWLFPEVERWTAEKIISTDQAALIRARYAEPEGGLSWGLILFFGLGAVVAGLGVILLFAYNWNAIPKFGKLALVFGFIAAAHAGGLRLRAGEGWRTRLGEALSLLGTMGFGAGIWLVAQIYNIDEHFPNGFLIWALGALALAWVLESVAHGLLATVLLAIWGGAEAIAFRAPVDASTLVLAAGVGPLAWRLRSALLLAVALAAFYWLLLCNVAHWGGGAGVFGNALALSVLLIALAKGDGAARFAGAGREVLTFFGWAGFLVCSYLLSFHATTRSLLRWSSDEAQAGVIALVYRWLFFILAASAWARLLARWRRSAKGTVPIEEWLCPIALVYCQGLGVFAARGSDTLVSIVFNLVCLAVATAWMVRGCREGSLRLTVLGSVLLSAVMIARYFDLFHSLALRGLAFVVFGAVLFAEGFFYRRLRRTAAGEAPGS